MKQEDRGWMRIVGGGCFVNAALTGLLIGLASTISIFSVDSIAMPFLISATVSFGISLFLVRNRDDQGSVMRKVALSTAGVLLGSVFAVVGIALILIISSG